MILRIPSRFPALALAMVSALLFQSCGQEAAGPVAAADIFIPVDTNFSTTKLIVPGGGYEARVLFREGDMTRGPKGDTAAPARGSHDFLAFVPLNGDPEHGILWTNHETTEANPVHGDGGGATVLEVFRDSVDGWKVIGFPHSVDFSPVGGTMTNCLGAATPWGTILTSEEREPSSNRYLHKNDSNYIVWDTSNVNGLKRHLNYGWMVEVDPLTRKAIAKHYAMGRFMHEGAYCMPDKKTVYLMDDIGPGAFFRFVADQPGDYSSGQLSAFKLGPDGKAGTWVDLPRERDSLIYARKMAFKRGASIFIRLEDIELAPDGTFYMTETGLDSSDLQYAIDLGGKVMPHLEKYHIGNGVYDDKFGRLLRFDPRKNTVVVHLEAGQAEDKSLHLSNPDNLALDSKRNQLVIHEDIVGRSHGRVPAHAQGRTINEIYVLDLSIAQPKLDDLRRLAVIPEGAESTGGVWSPDFSALFFNLQHPSEGNPPPFNRAGTVVLTGWPE